MLSDTLLDEATRQALAQPDAGAAIPLAGGALARANAGFQSYAELRAARPSPMARLDAAEAPEDHRTGFEDTCAAVAEAAGQLATDPIRQLADAIPGLFRGDATGAVALRKYWVDLGLPPACVDAYIAEVSKAPPPALVQVVRAILDSDDWPEAVKVFGTGNPDPNEWGFGFSTTADLNRSASAFATISRQAGIMPSVYLMASMVLLLQKIGGELAPK